MKAWVLHTVGKMQLENVENPVLKSGEILVKVMCAGICSSDIQRVFLTGAHCHPIILGHEFSGKTSDGRRVGVFPLLPCYMCESCKCGKYETCIDYGYIGSRQNGAFAEYVAVPEWNLIKIPETISYEQAALLEPATVALHAVNSIDLKNAHTVAVVGDGTIGKLITKWLSIFGVSSVDLLGRESRQSLLRYDVCVEAAGNSHSFGRSVELVRPNGQIVLVGNPDVNFQIGQALYWQVLRKQITVHGSWNSAYPSDWKEAIKHLGQLNLEGLISHRYPFEKLDDALKMMHGKKEKYYKVILKNEE